MYVCHISSCNITIFAAHYCVVNVLLSNVIISLFCGVLVVRNIQCCPYTQIENVNCLYYCWFISSVKLLTCTVWKYDVESMQGDILFSTSDFLYDLVISAEDWRRSKVDASWSSKSDRHKVWKQKMWVFFLSKFYVVVRYRLTRKFSLQSRFRK